MTLPRAFIRLLPVAFALALVALPRASAHILPQPAFIAQGAPATVALVVPNEREPHSTVSVALTSPRGLDVVSVEPTDGWAATTDGNTVTWTGGPLRGTADATFRVVLATDESPGPVTLRAVQRYDDGQSVNWEIPFSVVPGAEAAPDGGDDRGGLAIGAVVVALLVVGSVGVVLVARRRQGP